MSRIKITGALLIALAATLAARDVSAGGGGGSKSLNSVRVQNNSTSAATPPLVNVETVPVGDAGNAAVTVNGTSRGAVSDSYRIGKFEVSISQYAAFLNSIAKEAVGPDAPVIESLYDSRMASDLNVAGINRTGAGTDGSPYSYAVAGDGNKPIAYITWFNAARFANWMHNGATDAADTETGAYTLDGALSGTFTKNGGATWWIPTDDEWFKAAYYKGGGLSAGYWNYPTQSDSFPQNNDSSGANGANFRRNDIFSVTQSGTLDPAQNYLTAAGSFINSPSAYGTLDQGGNVDEWTDTVVVTGFGNARITRGGAWNSGGLNADVNPVSTALPGDKSAKIGFRLARSLFAISTPLLSGSFDLSIVGAAGAPRRIEPGQVAMLTVRSGSFSIKAADAIIPSVSATQTFSTGNKRTTRLTIDTSGGTINIAQAAPDANF